MALDRVRNDKVEFNPIIAHREPGICEYSQWSRRRSDVINGESWLHRTISFVSTPLRGQTLIFAEELLDNLGWKREVRVRYFGVLAPVPGLAILAAGISTLYYYSSLAVPGDLSSHAPLFWDVFVIASGAVLSVIGTLAQIKWSKLRASVILLRRLVLAFGLIFLGFVFVIIEVATDTLVCVNPPAGFGPARTCLQYGYAHQFLWLGALGSGMVLLGILVSALEEKRQLRPPDPHHSGLRAT